MGDTRYQNRREYMREYQRKWLATRRAAWFKDKVCVVCGATDGLEIHHIDPALKISHNVWVWTQARRDAELAKCEVVCKRHHRSRHAKLNEVTVTEMRRLRGAGVRYATLAREFGVDESTVRYAINCGWKDVR